jgi:uncharacterized membrane protein
VTDRLVASCRPVVAVFAAATVLGQVGYPLVHGSARDRLAIAVVVLFAAASVSHAWVSRGARVAVAVVLATAVPGFVVEVLGVHTGYPFGHYAYAATLGVRLCGVPLVIALAWTMFAWPAALVARRLVRSFAARVAVGAWALASWDLFLDPQMVSAAHWRWQFPTPHLPGVDDVPLTNYLGWLLAATLISLVLQGILGSDDADDRWPYALYLWTWASSVLALAAFLDLGVAALWGGLGMGLVALPLAWSLASSSAAPQ